jgi:PAS domain S-box-containing protein
MNIQQRTAKTLSPPGQSATPDVARALREERLRAREERLAVKAEQALARRSEEQAALFHFSEKLQYATSLPDVYNAGLDAILAALACERASILLFDDSDAMRFVGWRGLSDGYRMAVEGHSPWDRGEANPRPVTFEDIGVSALSDRLKETIAREHIAAVAFIPIMIGGRLAGKFMAYYDRPHHFVEPEIDVALTLARQLGFGIARLRTEQARCAAEERARQLVSIVESTDDAIISKDLDGIIRSWNPGAERLFGYTAGEAIGKPVTILFPPGHEDEELGILARIGRGERIHHYETVRRRKDGSLLDISLTVSPVCDGTGSIVGASKIVRDITDRKDAERKLRESEQRLTELLAAIPAAIYTTDAQGKITYFNQAAVEFSGERRQAETQQRLLLDELNHRTKNNMQMLQSLLFCAARTAHSEEARKVLNEASARIAAMAAAQRVLYGRSDASHFAAEEFLPAVCETIRQLLPPDARIECGIARGVLSNDVAMPLALILNELLTNAVKHGVKDHARQGVRVSLTGEGGRLALCVEDDGEGFDLEEVRTTSSGLQLVLGLARQLHGTLYVTKNPSRARLDFPAAKI